MVFEVGEEVDVGGSPDAEYSCCKFGEYAAEEGEQCRSICFFEHYQHVNDDVVFIFN